ncbi:MAG: type II toxin-antitoxin system RelE/ParE family toxin [Bacteroidales bacterium]|nr:type II toxin-antitoxin system RelE/ParE family toxin [Bacteroidales bacterium]
MIIEFKDCALEELYLFGSTKNHKYYKLTKEIIKQYIKTVNYIKAVTQIEDLFFIKSLHYEKKGGDLKGNEAVWINRQYRLIFKSSSSDKGHIVEIQIIEISKHYE